MSGRIDRVATVILTLSAAVIAVVVVLRELRTETASAIGVPQATESVYHADWTTWLSKSVVMGTAGAPVTLVEFIDLECPFCRRLHETALKDAQREFGNKLAVAFIHFPLANHKFAIPAATALECANDDGVFEPMLDVLFAKQDSFGLKRWGSYAQDAGVRGLSKFESCINAKPAARIEAGRELGRAVGVRGTPTLLLNGWTFPTPPSTEELRAAITQTLDEGRPRFAKDSSSKRS